MRLTSDEQHKARWPMTLRELRIERRDPKMAAGSLVFSELRAAGPIEPLDRVNIKLATDAPANVFFVPKPAILHAAVENPTDSTLEGRLKTVVEDWLGRVEVFEHGPITLAPKATATRTLQIPLERLGPYRAWVRVRDRRSLSRSSAELGHQPQAGRTGRDGRGFALWNALLRDADSR